MKTFIVFDEFAKDQSYSDPKLKIGPKDKFIARTITPKPCCFSYFFKLYRKLSKRGQQ